MLQIPLEFLLAIELSIEADGIYRVIVIFETIFTTVGYFIFKRDRWKSVKVCSTTSIPNLPAGQAGLFRDLPSCVSPFTSYVCPT